jgi:hypothetical protein
MFEYKNNKGIMCIVDTSTNKKYRLSMPHEVVEVVALLNAAQQSAHADAGDSAASSELVQASSESTSQTVTQPTQRG